MDIPVRRVRRGAEGTTSKLIGGDNASGVTLHNVTLGSACPRCGGDMKVIDGTYSFTDGVMTAFRQLDADSLREVESVLRQRQRGDVELAAAIAQVSAVCPQNSAASWNGCPGSLSGLRLSSSTRCSRSSQSCSHGWRSTPGPR